MNRHIPSRHTNPFATCWTRPGAMSFVFPAHQSVDQMVEQLAASGWQGAIVGPHGSGKSTLVATLGPRCVAAGRTLALCTLRAGERHLPRGFLGPALAAPHPLVLVDGYEQLAWYARWQLRWRCRHRGAGLLVTTHAATDLPTLYHTNVNQQLIETLVSSLVAENSSLISTADIVASHARHGSNLRELFFSLYRRHEILVAGRR